MLRKEHLPMHVPEVTGPTADTRFEEERVFTLPEVVVGRSGEVAGCSDTSTTDDLPGVPAIFYNDDPPPLPPPGDPHWGDWPAGSANEPVPHWLPMACAGFILAVTIVHILFIFILLH